MNAGLINRESHWWRYQVIKLSNSTSTMSQFLRSSILKHLIHRSKCRFRSLWLLNIVFVQLMWWTTAEGNWLLTSAKNHLESSWLQVIEKWFIALMTAYSFIFEQMNSESSHHRTNGTWRWTLFTGLDRHGGAWDLLRQTHTLINTETFSTHTAVVFQTLTVPVRRSEKTMVRSRSVH